MAEQKRFRKITLNSDDYKWIEDAAKATKGIGTAVGILAAGMFLKDQLSDSEEPSNDEEEQEED